MQALKTRPGVHRGGILSLRVEDISPNPVQPRRHFDEAGLRELSDSIRSYGILNPLTVRLRCGKYELVAGERRLRAAKLAGLREVPCLLLAVSEEDSSVLALIENLQRRDLDFTEEAAALAQLIREHGLSQEEAARRLGRSQSSVANKLRLLRLSPAMLEAIREAGLSERHARALLRLETEEQRLRALERIRRDGLSVAQTEALVETLLAGPPAPRRRTRLVARDGRLLLNALRHALDLAREAGLEADCVETETEENVTVTITVPKKSR